MESKIHYLQLHHSGGAANEDPLNDLGGQISTATNKEIISQISTPPALVTGVTIKNAFANQEGSGSLIWTSTTSLLAWKPYGQPVANGEIITADGLYLIGDTTGYLVVDVVLASLPATNKVDVLTVANNSQNVFDIIGSALSLSGHNAYRGIYLKNTHSSITATDVTIWIDEQTEAGDYLQIGIDPAGAGDGTTTGVMTTIASETDAPAGVSFSIPVSKTTGIVIGSLLAGQVIGVWINRVVPEETRGTVISNSATLAINAII
jgi:hypothetical protein